MSVEYEIASDIAILKGVANSTQLASVVQFYTGNITYDDEAGSKYATVTIDGKTQRVLLCIAVSGDVTYDDVPSKYSTVSGHRCLTVIEPTGTETPDDVPSVSETVTVSGKNVRAIRCVLINETPVYDGNSSTCTFVDSGKTHTAQLVNVFTGQADVIVRGTSPLSLPDAVADELYYVKAFGLADQQITPAPDVPTGILCNNGGIGIDANGDITIIGNTETIKDSKNNTVTCEPLLSLASYHDEQEILTGAITRRIGIKVLDGTEDWQSVSTWFEANILDNGLFTGILCTHFPMGVPTNPDTIHSMTGKLQINYSG